MTRILFILIAILAFCLPPQLQSAEREAIVITIERTGGYAGVDDHVSVHANSEFINENGKVRHMTPAIIEGFIRSIEKVGAPAPNMATVSLSYCSDCFTYKITICRGDVAVGFVVAEPILGSSEKDPDDVRTIRDFLTMVFSKSYHKR
jgi:hypothetical protein